MQIDRLPTIQSWAYSIDGADSFVRNENTYICHSSAQYIQMQLRVEKK